MQDTPNISVFMKIENYGLGISDENTCFVVLWIIEEECMQYLYILPWMRTYLLNWGGLVYFTDIVQKIQFKKIIGEEN